METDENEEKEGEEGEMQDTPSLHPPSTVGTGGVAHEVEDNTVRCPCGVNEVRISTIPPIYSDTEVLRVY